MGGPTFLLTIGKVENKSKTTYRILVKEDIGNTCTIKLVTMVLGHSVIMW
jgi:hypothetical protein